jgi:hypothetical protein
MGCRVGITTDPERRQSEWETVYKNLRQWQILGTYAKREDAQALETKTAEEHGCEASPGGNEPDNPNVQWSVYHFYHDGEK